MAYALSGLQKTLQVFNATAGHTLNKNVSFLDNLDFGFNFILSLRRLFNMYVNAAYQERFERLY